MTRARRGSRDESREVRISKALTQILRHRAIEFGLNVRSDGYIQLDEVLATNMVSKLNATMKDILMVVEESDKKRFEIMEEGAVTFIRAVQGHSMKVVLEENLMVLLRVDQLDLPEECVHGTYRRFLNSILKDGLRAGGKLGPEFRNHIHFAPYAPWDGRVVSGMRYNAEVAIWVDLRKAINAGIRFFLSKNQVILTSGIEGTLPPEFFSRVLDLKTGVDLSGGLDNTSGDVAEVVSSRRRSGYSALLSSEEFGFTIAYYRFSVARRLASQAQTSAVGAEGEEVTTCTASEVPVEVSGAEVLFVPSPAVTGSEATDLLTRLSWDPSRPHQGPFSVAVVYLHGFPDQSLDHRRESDRYGTFSSRFPRKLCGAVLRNVPDALFTAFNFSGTPGSDEFCPFHRKTVSRELSDAKAVIRFLRQSGRLLPEAHIHVVGLSTGAIIAALLRGFDEKMTVTTVAGLVDPEVGLTYDFDDLQLQAFEANGFCLKEFWLPVGSSSNPPGDFVDIGAPGSWQKVRLRLDSQYQEDFLTLDIASAVREGRCPLLVIHGDADENVPVANGMALFEKAIEPKTRLIIAKGNHLLTTTKHFDKAAATIISMIKHS